VQGIITIITITTPALLTAEHMLALKEPPAILLMMNAKDATGTAIRA